jgi:hypothetical protein
MPTQVRIFLIRIQTPSSKQSPLPLLHESRYPLLGGLHPPLPPRIQTRSPLLLLAWHFNALIMTKSYRRIASLEADPEVKEAEIRARLAGITTIQMTCPSALAGMFTDPTLKPCQPWRTVAPPTPPASRASSPIKCTDVQDGAGSLSLEEEDGRVGGVEADNPRSLTSSRKDTGDHAPRSTIARSPPHPNAAGGSRGDPRPHISKADHHPSWLVGSSILDLLITSARISPLNPLQNSLTAFRGGDLPHGDKICNLVVALGGLFVDEEAINRVNAPMRYLIHPPAVTGTKVDRVVDGVSNLDIQVFLDMVRGSLETAAGI